ncbi:glycoside hydrolase family 65 protein [Oenococcus sicerae]|uniref:Glycoside hydrolase family 65 protein n=1 Tax=Oenococcus sicerae TaxID=2203724 RepID=A0AAJ1RA13_9LACO|nr:glycosyl hydrolase family 65 protein [Oenococcus sicerae]MDN6900944.1 glycoside hydrolase family 65 protein [Oenococcus sicerae]
MDKQKSLMNYERNSPWTIGEIGFDSQHLGKSESIFSQGNGYLGLRATLEENYVNQKRDMFVAGTFNKFDNDEVTELPNVPDVVGIDIKINDIELNLNQGKISNYSLDLNLKTGELVRKFDWQYRNVYLRFVFRRFVSFANRHLLAQNISIENLSDIAADIYLESGINGQVTNSGSQHFSEGIKVQHPNNILQMISETTQSKIRFIQSTRLIFTEPTQIKRSLVAMGRRKIFQKISLYPLLKNQKLSFSKYSTVFTSIDKDAETTSQDQLIDQARFFLEKLVGDSFDKLFNESISAWNHNVWEKHEIQIDSIDSTDQLSLNFARYHLHSMVPSHDARMNIGAKGFSGEGYKGHTFWDTEIFMLPYFILAYPEIAKKLVTYRFLGLSGAEKKAKLNHYEGAQYPWESAWPDDGEATPVWGGIDIVTGKPTKIWSGFIEQHITSDVAYGVKQYIDATGDIDFAYSKGCEIIFETAKFWSSRLSYNPSEQLYEIKNVIGPDEYKEHVNNNAFTNYSAQWNIYLAIELYDDLKNNHSSVFEDLNNKLGIADYISDWREKVKKIYLPKPNDKGVIPQDDDYLNKKVIDLSKYKSEDQVGALFDDYNLKQVNNMQITKQADIILLFFLFDSLFTKKIQKINLDYYLPKTMHDSSLSLSTHAIIAADIGQTATAYDFFQKEKNIDMGSFMDSSNDGVHAASLGGIWNSVVQGFGGVRIIDGILRIEPNLPEAWKSLTFNIFWKNNRLDIQEFPDRTLITRQSSTDSTKIFVSSKLKEYELISGKKITIPKENIMEASK